MKVKLLILATITLFLTPRAAAHIEAGDTIIVADSLAPAAADTLEADSAITAADSLLPWPQRVSARLERLTADNMFETSQLGLCIYDITADSVVWQRGMRQTLRPASTEKLLTAVTALQQLGGSYRFETRLYITGTVADSVLQGNVYIRGGMDPLFGHDDMRAFAMALLDHGIDSIAGEVRTDSSIKDTLAWGSGWCWDDEMTPLRALLYNGKDRFMEEFFGALDEAGIASAGRAEEAQVSLEPEAENIATRYHSIDQVLIPMLKESDNTCAEALFYQLGANEGGGYPSARRSADKVKALISRMGLDPSRYVVADGSGVSLYNYLSAELLVRTLVYARQRSNIYDHLYPSLPVAGEDGTLHSRMRRTSAHFNVHAKTGTVEGVASLAGYATSPEGHELAFAIINQGVLHGSNGRRFQDRVCRAITEK